MLFVGAAHLVRPERLSEPGPGDLTGRAAFLPINTAAAGSYGGVTLGPGDVQSTSPYLGGGSTDIPVQFFRARYRVDQTDLFPVEGVAPPDLFDVTSTGWEVNIPAVDEAEAPVAAPNPAQAYPSCHAEPAVLPSQIEALTSTPLGQSHAATRLIWYATSCAPSVTVYLREDQHLGYATEAPTSSEYGRLTWQGGREGLGPITASVTDETAVSAAQHDLLLSGVLFGIAGGVVAAWLIAGTTVLASAGRKKTSSPSTGEPQGSLRESDTTRGAIPRILRTLAHRRN